MDDLDQEKSSINVYQTVLNLRRERAFMVIVKIINEIKLKRFLCSQVQKPNQYLFIHQCLASYIKMKNKSNQYYAGNQDEAEYLYTTNE